ncbi:703_t:CDS:2 [Entrophospora sp. SA101]|nr:703_t:CDS:2 [Entrophospora sp. SA101]
MPLVILNKEQKGPEEVLNFGDLETLKEQHQEYLKSQETNSEADEAQTLADAIRLSLGIFNPDDLLPKSKLSDQELEKYLQEKRLDLKKYFVFNLGKEVETIPQTVSDVSGEVVSEKVPNLRQVKPLLAEHLTQLFNDAVEAQPQVKVFQSKKNVLKFLRENDFKCQAVSCPEEIIGEKNYCLYHQTCLAKLEEKKDIPNIQEIDTFKTNEYTTFANLVGEPQVRVINLPCETETRVELIDAAPSLDHHHGEPNSISMPVEVEIGVPNKNPDGYLKPLDVVWVRKAALPGVRYWHVGVYLGDEQVCHFSSESKRRETNRTIITD